MSSTIAADSEFPRVEQLPVSCDLPNPLVSFGGKVISTADEWRARRRPELIKLFEHYMYGAAPIAPRNVRVAASRSDEFLDGDATMRQITLAYGPPNTPRMHVLLFTPSGDGPWPLFVGLNFPGNQATVNDSRVDLPTAWLPDRYDGVVDNRATDASRGVSSRRWPIAQITNRGFAVATIYCGDIDPDRDDFSDGVHPAYYAPGQTQPGPHEWGTIAAWAWGLSRAIDYLETDPAIDSSRIAVFGHSRLGKTALLAAALDERIALVVANQSGCGGASLSRSPRGEQLSDINKNFPHWFNDTFPRFNTAVERLPFDQHSLIALCAPRPVLLSCAVEDQWADPLGQFEALKAAEPAYQLFGVQGCDADTMPEPNQPSLGTLGFNIRPGKHDVTSADWNVFMDFADRNSPR